MEYRSNVTSLTSRYRKLSVVFLARCVMRPLRLQIPVDSRVKTGQQVLIVKEANKRAILTMFKSSLHSLSSCSDRYTFSYRKDEPKFGFQVVQESIH